MASQKLIKSYRSWSHEAKRAKRLGKPNYEASCNKEVNRLLKKSPELKGEECTCPECK